MINAFKGLILSSWIKNFFATISVTISFEQLLSETASRQEARERLARGDRGWLRPRQRRPSHRASAARRLADLRRRAGDRSGLSRPRARHAARDRGRPTARDGRAGRSRPRRDRSRANALARDVGARGWRGRPRDIHKCQEFFGCINYDIKQMKIMDFEPVKMVFCYYLLKKKLIILRAYRCWQN